MLWHDTRRQRSSSMDGHSRGSPPPSNVSSTATLRPRRWRGTSENAGVSRAAQFAYVLQAPVLDPQRLGEIVAVNRGMWVKAFDNLADALGWLGCAPATKPGAGDA